MSTDTTRSDESESLTEKGRLAARPDRFENGDSILWEGRSTSLTVIEAAHIDGEHSDPRELAVEGPQGGIVTVSYDKYTNSWQTSSDGRVEVIVIVDDSDRRPVTLAGETAYTTVWECPADDCPHCVGVDRSADSRFKCEYLKTDFYTRSPHGGEDSYHEYQDGDGLPKKLLRAVCAGCGGVVYEHPAYQHLAAGETPIEL